MAKGGSKSSASSGTRKKHARRAAVANGAEEPIPKEKKPKNKEKRKKIAKKEPRQKVYIAPIKPAPIRPDPLETTGLMHRLPPELLVVLRNLAKKSVVTKIRALEDLQSGWVDNVLKEQDGDEYVLLDMLPVWLHHLPVLFIHYSRRIRYLAAGVHACFLRIPSIRDQILFSIFESMEEDQASSIIGTWSIAVHDIDKSVATAAAESWSKLVKSLAGFENTVRSLQSFVHRAALDPSGVYNHINPIAPQAPLPARRKGPRGRPAQLQNEFLETERSKAEADEENESDRKARLRIGAFGSIRWVLEHHGKERIEDSVAFFTNPTLWSALHHSQICPFLPPTAECFGAGQPSVRKSAWNLVQVVLKTLKDRSESFLPILSTAVLRSAWVEPDTMVQMAMWQPLLIFLKEHPRSWQLELAFELHDVDSESEDSDDDDDAASSAISPETSPSGKLSLAYREFLQFLQLGCSGSPLQGYPTVVIVLSTIPSSILTSAAPEKPLSEFFTSFWAALDGRALNSLQRTTISSAFLSSLLECTLFLIRRMWRAINSSEDTVAHQAMLLLGTSTISEAEDGVKFLVKEQLERVWQELVTKDLKVEERTAASLLTRYLADLQGVDLALYHHAWEVLSDAMNKSLTINPSLLSTTLKAFIAQDNTKETTGVLNHAACDFLKETLSCTLEKCESALRLSADGEEETSEYIPLLVSLIDAFTQDVFSTEEFSKRLDGLVNTSGYELLVNSPSLLRTYYLHRGDEEKRSECWHNLLVAISSHPETFDATLSQLLNALEEFPVFASLIPKAYGLDELISNLLVESLRGPPGADQVSLIRRTLKVPAPLLTQNGLHTLLHSIASSFSLQTDNIMRNAEISPSSFAVVLDLLSAALANIKADSSLLLSVLSDVFCFAYLIPKCCEDDSEAVFLSAEKIWIGWLGAASDQTSVFLEVKARLKSILEDTNVRPLPEHVVEALKALPPSWQVEPIRDLLPSQSEFDLMLDELCPDPLSSSLTVLDPLLPPGSERASELALSRSCDTRGHSLYARLVDALLCIVFHDRYTARENVWCLRHLFAFEMYAEDLINFPSGQSPVFDRKAVNVDLSDLIVRVQQIGTYVLTSVPSDEWRRSALSRLTGNPDVEGLTPHAGFLVELLQRTETIRESRILHEVLEHAFNDIDKDEADAWVAYSRKIEKASPQTSMTIIAAISRYSPELPRLERYRNELAASLLGVPAQKANSDGLMTLRKLAATAPDAESDVVFLPQQRAVNIVKACQKWISSEEDIEEEVESAMTLTFFHLAPILQNIPGGHWAFILDVIENNLENSDMTDDSTLTTLARTLRLVILLQDLASTNKSLRADWDGRQNAILTVVRDLATSRLDPESPSAPASTCRELVLSIVQNLPASLITHETMPKMCHLLTDASASVQKMAYQLLQQAAKKRTEYLVIEAGVDTEDKVKAELPPELIMILQEALSVDALEENEQEQNVFGHLLGWMLLFDLFVDTSLKVRISYVDQLRTSSLITTHFLPSILGLLSLDQGIMKAFKLDVWAVDEYLIQLYEPGTTFSLQVLAAHLYYRALLTVPSLIRSWVLDCKDRQLSSAIAAYTSSHFSPVIIKTELAHVKSPEATTALAGENLTVKVSSLLNEVTASYLVDEHQLEIKLKIPPDWPLHKIEIRDMKRVGVDERRWRAWTLAVQQTIWAQNGRIVDGIALFKKNVTLHFEGQAECAICYSILSVMDGSMPKKPCRTCKNRFHAGCLYKWFDSSHSSSCPLCRSDILL